MKYTTGLAAALLCALPLSGAFAWGDRSSSNAGQSYGPSYSETQGFRGQANAPQSFSQREQLSPSQGTIRNAQQALAQAGADVPLDGRMDAQTERAILNYQVLHQLPITGQLDQATLRSLNIS